MSMIVAIEGLIPDRRAGAAERNPTAPPTKPQIYQSEWLRRQKEKDADSQPNTAHDEEEDKVGVLGRLNPLPALSLTPASPPSPMARASRKRNTRLMPLLLQTPGSPSLSQRTPLPGAADLPQSRPPASPTRGRMKRYSLEFFPCHRSAGAPYLARFSRDVGYHGASPAALPPYRHGT